MHNFHSMGGLSSRVFGGGEAAGEHRRGRVYHSTSMVGPPYPPLPVKCPRCDSVNTKFCYYNNYNLSQPRHFCKSCRRYWTKGGVLRNVPVGGGCRKPKRSASKSHCPVSASTTPPDSVNTLGSSSSNPNPPAFDLPTGDVGLSILMGVDEALQNIPDPAPPQPVEKVEGALMHQMHPGEIPDDGWLPVADGGIFEIAGAGFPSTFWSQNHWTSDGDPPLYLP